MCDSDGEEREEASEEFVPGDPAGAVAERAVEWTAGERRTGVEVEGETKGLEVR